MNNEKGVSFIKLEQLAGGAFAEKINEALLQVAENIQNPNTDATAKRGITINIKFSPSKTRQLANTTISVTTKLAPTEAIDLQMVMGTDIRTGKLEIAEYDGSVRGQLSFNDYTQPNNVFDEPQAEQLEPQPAGKPLDLRNRTKQRQAAVETEHDTEESYETAGQTADDHQTTTGRVVPIVNMTAKA